MIFLPSTGVTESQPERIFFDYLTKSYKVFLAGNDDFDAMVQELVVTEQKNAIVSFDLTRLSGISLYFGKGISIFRFGRITS